MKIDYKLSQRISLLTLTAWMSVCLLISGFFPNVSLQLQNLWALSGCLGLVASFGLVHKIKNELLAQQKLMDSMQSEAETDALTKLANRRVLEKQLIKCVDGLKSDQQPFIVSLIDIDCFKTVNDTFGHQKGDCILRFVSNMLSITMGEESVVARYGGDEFAVIVKSADLEIITTKLNRVRSRVAHDSQYSDELESVTISIGLALAKEEDTPNSIIERADKALYKAKNEGRNRTIVDSTPEPAAHTIAN